MNKSDSSRRRGFTLVEVMIVVTIVLILACIAVPGLRRYRRMSLAQRCIANIRTIQHARESYFYDHPTETILADVNSLNPYLPLNLASGEQYKSITCVGLSYLIDYSGVSNLNTLPRCPNFASSDTDIAQDYGEHTIRE